MEDGRTGPQVSPDKDGGVREGGTLSIPVLQTIKAAQAQHGLRHGDYQRYRRYCTARLRRLYKSLKFLHGRGKYVKKTIEPAMVADIRYLLIPLYCAERAWGYAMELKQLPGGPSSRQRFHLIRRLTKAARWGDVLAALCSEKADSRTALEAEAYASWMWGNVKLEREDDWEGALVKFLRARTVYEQLGKVGNMEHQVLCRQRVEELEPSVRYCNYKMGRSKGGDLLEMSRAMDGPALDLLQSKLEAVMAEDRARQAAQMEELTWHGRRIPLNNAKTRLCILRGQELDKELQVADSTPIPLERKLALYDKIFVEYQEAKRHVREDLNVAGGMAAAPREVRDEISTLDAALTTLLLHRTIERNQLLVSSAQAKLLKQQTQRGKEDKAAAGEKEKAVRPEDLVRLYDALIQNVADLAQVEVRDRRREDEEAEKQLAVKRLCFQAFRCFYLGQSYAAASKFAEAYLLYKRAEEYAAEAGRAGKEGMMSGGVDEAMMLEVQDVANQARAQRCLVHADGAMQNASTADGIGGLVERVGSLSIKENAPTAMTKEGQQQDQTAGVYLTDMLDRFESAVGSSAAAGRRDAPPRIAQIPPSFRSVPCEPLMLNTALSAIQFPSLDHRVKKKKKGWFW
ncbi:hypothetical protein CBR_g20988 [Chara braunii]|uniref:Signal recognition particle subunit SRP68 n=1 Tax=Chara braunii TaxID=69332 RepID=A0A388L0E0_CHABU|nr:hypothetical protein CBR_g20988 [Chara braunii]|eukprot:GBG75741.1 hypothetical protein CBR_g20988 [Chara braunii]